MNEELLDALAPIEDEFGVLLLDEAEALHFVELDMKSMIKTINEEIELYNDRTDFINGMEYAKGLMIAFMQNRIDEGY